MNFSKLCIKKKSNVPVPFSQPFFSRFEDICGASLFNRFLVMYTMIFQKILFKKNLKSCQIYVVNNCVREAQNYFKCIIQQN